MSLYSMKDAHQEGAMGLSDMFLRDWAQGQTTRKCTISGQAHQRCAIWGPALASPGATWVGCTCPHPPLHASTP